jgi:hypothetical protein
VRLRFASIPAALLALFAATFTPATAHAEPTSWLAVGPGYSLQRNGVADYDARATTLSLSLGVGTSANNPFVIGGIGRAVTYFTLGTDLGLAARLATRGFARGDWGFALDAGVTARWWERQAYGHFPVQVVATLGMPWGFQLGLGADVWDVSGDTPTARGGFAVFEIDLLRLTVMRNGATTRWWPNPSPADAQRPQ